jgi:hypothetical protein
MKTKDWFIEILALLCFWMIVFLPEYEDDDDD